MTEKSWFERRWAPSSIPLVGYWKTPFMGVRRQKHKKRQSVFSAEVKSMWSSSCIFFTILLVCTWKTLHVSRQTNISITESSSQQPYAHISLTASHGKLKCYGHFRHLAENICTFCFPFGRQFRPLSWLGRNHRLTPRENFLLLYQQSAVKASMRSELAICKELEWILITCFHPKAVSNKILRSTCTGVDNR